MQRCYQRGESSRIYLLSHDGVVLKTLTSELSPFAFQDPVLLIGRPLLLRKIVLLFFARLRFAGLCVHDRELHCL
jgi:hypothetical protein